MGKHTKGPWTVDKKEFRVLSKNEEFHIALLDPAKCMRDSMAIANANLIATAPELLAVCKQSIEAFNYLGGSEEIIELLEKAIDKAEGK